MNQFIIHRAARQKAHRLTKAPNDAALQHATSFLAHARTGTVRKMVHDESELHTHFFALPS